MGKKLLTNVLASPFLLGTVDVLLVMSTYLAAAIVRFGGNLHPDNNEAIYAVIPWLGLTFVIISEWLDVRDLHHRSRADIAVHVLVVVAIQGLAGLAAPFALRYFAFPRSVILIAAVLQYALLMGWRALLWRHQRSEPMARSLVICTEEEVPDIMSALAALSGTVAEQADIFTAAAAGEDGSGRDEARVIQHLESVMATSPHSSVILGRSVADGVRHAVLAHTTVQGGTVYVVPKLEDLMICNSELVSVGDLPLLRLPPVGIMSQWRFAKRLLDLAVSVVGLALTLPLMLMIAMAILLLEGPPVLYLQPRVGVRGRIFNIYKFRTMIRDAEAASGPVLATERDPRITAVGRVLRASRLDELPQLVNVLVGDMSLVGPRPERPPFVEEFSRNVPGYAARLHLKPGITGLAQVEGKYDTHARDKLVFDLYYGKAYTPLLDLKVMAKTLATVIRPHRAR